MVDLHLLALIYLKIFIFFSVQIPTMAGGAEEEERRIAVAIDDSEESMQALKWSLNNFLSAHSRNVLILIYVRPQSPIDPSMDGTGYVFSDEVMNTMEKYQQDMAKSILRKARQVIEDHHHSHKVVELKKKIVTGEAGHVICNVVEKLAAHLLVVGSHGYGPLRRTFLGSVSDYCLFNAKCPVMIVKRPVEPVEPAILIVKHPVEPVVPAVH